MAGARRTLTLTTTAVSTGADKAYEKSQQVRQELRARNITGLTLHNATQIQFGKAPTTVRLPVLVRPATAAAAAASAASPAHRILCAWATSWLDENPERPRLPASCSLRQGSERALLPNLI